MVARNLPIFEHEVGVGRTAHEEGPIEHDLATRSRPLDDLKH
jgi:hypothetical protein